MILLLLAAGALATEFVLLPQGSTWTYLDTGVDPGPDWMDPSFDDTAWLSGPAPFGYGAFGLATVVDYGPDPLDKHVTTWFRTEFTAVGTAGLTGLVLSLRADDGAVIYLNGVEVHRRNLPDGPIAATTFAEQATNGVVSREHVRVPLDTSQLLEGDNTLAVEVHQHTANSPDLALEAALYGYDGATALTRGPYLQQSSDDGVIVRWRTLGPSESTVWYGAAPGALTNQVDVAGLALDHEVEISGLGPSTTWTYAVGSPADGVLAGDDADHQLTTHPPPGTRQPVRIWVLGDSGTADANAEAVRDAFHAYSALPDLLLMLGDNAYGSGTDAEYQDAVFDIFPDTLRQRALWSTIGNHDGYSASSLLQSGPYFDIFSFPTAGEVGGVPSGTEAYYSFDYANIHFVCLDSYGSDRSVGGAMLTWLEADLAATTADWVIAFWHHPPYSKGSHDSDHELAMVQMRENVVPILESWGVDLVLTGHSHSYERSYLVDGHHGPSETLAQGMLLDDSDGTRDDGFAYRKPSVGPAPHEGAVHVVAGSSGMTSGGALNHPVMQISLNELGSLVLDVDGDSLDAVFLQDDGTEGDRFAIDKGVTAIVALDGPRAGAVESELAWTALALHPDGTEVASYEWTFGDGAVAAGASVAHTYPSVGVWPVTLTVPDLSGQPVVRTIEVLIDDGAPDVNVVTVPSPQEGALAWLSATASDVEGSPVTITWDFGDGGAAEGEAVSHVWNDDGVYDVAVTGTDADGDTTTVVVPVTVTNAPPTLDEVVAPAATEGTPVTLEAAASDPGAADVLTYTWDLLDGSPPLEGAAVEIAFGDEGAHTVRLRVADDDGGAVVEDVIVDVANVAPTVELVAVPEVADEGASVGLAAVAFDPGHDALTFTWDLGDGQVVTGASVVHAWPDDGAWPITLTVDDGDGGVGGESLAIEIVNVPPSLGAVVVPGEVDAGDVVTLHATPTDPGADDVVALTWDLGDGTVLQGAEVSHAWAEAGTWSVSVTATDDDGGATTVALAVVVGEPPAAQVSERGCGCRAAPASSVPWLALLWLPLVRRGRAVSRRGGGSRGTADRPARRTSAWSSRG